MAGGAAHDFNNVLTVILGEVSDLLEDVPDGPVRAREKAIQQAAFRASDLSRSLLDFSRHEREAEERVDLNALVRETHGLMARTLGEDVELEEVLQEPLPPVRGEPVRLQQVLVNLVMNARDAMPEGGCIRLRSQRLAGGVKVTVEDEGWGMDAQAQARAFDPYFTTKPPGHGTGLGLSMVRGIVEDLGGSVEIRSEPGQGTAVSLTFPAVGEPRFSGPADQTRWVGPEAGPDRISQHSEDRSRPEGRGISPNPEEEGCDQAASTVLLVDDDDAVRRSTRRMLERAGHTVVEASDGREALRMCEACPPDLVLTDVTMSGMDGPALAAAVSRRWPGLPVVFTSGDSGAARVESNDGDDRRLFLAKPFRSGALARKVAEGLLRSEGA